MERGEEHGTAESMIRDEGSHLPPLLLGDSTVLDRPLLFEKTEGGAPTQKGSHFVAGGYHPPQLFKGSQGSFTILNSVFPLCPKNGEMKKYHLQVLNEVVGMSLSLRPCVYCSMGRP